MGRFKKFSNWAMIIIFVLTVLTLNAQIENYEEMVAEQRMDIDQMMDKIHETSRYLREANFTIRNLKEEIEMLESEKELMEETIEKLRTIPAVITNYAPLDPNAVEGMCYSGNPNITATGTQVRRGIAAADPRRLPYGTKIYIPSFGEVIIEDTGSAMRNNDKIQIDVFVESRKEAFAYGIQNEEIKIIID